MPESISGDAHNNNLAQAHCVDNAVYKAMFESARDAVLIADDQGIYVDANPAAGQLLGIERAQLRGRRIEEFVETVKGIGSSGAARQAFNTAGEQRGECQLRKPDGQFIPVEYSAKTNFVPGLHLSILRDNTPHKLIEDALRSDNEELERRVRQRTAALEEANRLLTAEIARRRKAEASLVEWNNRYEAAIKATSRVMFDWNLETGELVFANTDNLLGYSGAEIGGLEGWMQLVHPDDRVALSVLIDYMVATGEAAQIEYRVRRKDGTLIHVLGDGHGVKDGAGKLTRMLGFVIDLSGLKRMEHRFPNRESNLRHDGEVLVNSLTDHAVFMLDTTGRVVSWNIGAERLKGYRPEEILGQHFSRFYPEEDVARGKPAKALEIAAREGRYSDEGLRVRKDGSLFWADVTIAPLRDETGRLTGFSKVTRDVSERHQSQRKLADTLAYLEKVFELSPIGIQTFRASGEMVTSNRAISEMAGASKERLLSLNFLKLESWRRYGLLSLAEKCLATGAPSQGEIRAQTTFGKELWVNAFFTTFEVDSETYLLGIFEDILERKRAEELRSESESLARTAIDSLSAEIAVLDSQGSIIAVNNAWKRFYRDNSGISDGSSCVGTSYLSVCERAIGMESNETALAALQGIRDVLDGRQSSFTLEYPCHSPDKQNWFQMRVLPMACINGGAIVAHENVTERKLAQHALSESEQYLRNIVDAAPFGAHTYEIRTGGRLEIVEANNASQKLLGIANHCLVGKTVEEAFPGVAGTELPALYRQVAEQGIEYHADQFGYRDQVISGCFEIHATKTGRDRMTVFFSDTTEMAMTYEETLKGWSRVMEYRDKETDGHTQRVTESTMRLAGVLGIVGTELLHMRWGALLHDIGKLAVPDNILFKADALTEEEWVVMRRHPEFAYQMLSNIKFLRPALEIPYCHHEKWDGTGYPRGLIGKSIPLSARIFALADVWDALRSDRPYRKAWNVERVTAHIVASAGTHFDPGVVEAFQTLAHGM